MRKPPDPKNSFEWPLVRQARVRQTVESLDSDDLRRLTDCESNMGRYGTCCMCGMHGSLRKTS